MKFFPRFLIPVLGIFLLLPACVDKDYDFDDLDKNAVFSPNGVNVPVGNLNKIVLLDEIEKHYEDILFDEKGELYVNFSGEFSDFEIPKFEGVPETNISIEPITQTEPEITINDFLPTEVVIADNSEVEFDINKPTIEYNDWNIDVKSIDFKSCKIQLSVIFRGIKFETSADKDSAIMNFEIVLPENFTVKNPKDPNKPRTIINAIDVRRFNNNKPFVIEADVANYQYKNTGNMLKYSAKITNGQKTRVTTKTSEFEFEMQIEAGTANTGTIKPSFVNVSAKIEENITGSITGMESFYDSFTSNDVFNFYNPQLNFDLKSNLGLAFSINAKFDAINGSTKNTININDPLIFTKPATKGGVEETNYWLSPKNIFPSEKWVRADLDQLFNHKPNQVDYTLVLKADQEDAYFVFDDVQLNGNYNMKVPLSFSQLNLNVKDTLRDVFSEDIYDQFFKNAKAGSYVSIEADSVDVSLGKPVVKDAVNMSVAATILDNNGKKIDGLNITVSPSKLANGLNIGDNRLVIKITSGSDGFAKMKDAKHLSLNFTINGKSTGADLPLILTKDDYIGIRKLRLISSDGIHFTL